MTRCPAVYQAGGAATLTGVGPLDAGAAPCLPRVDVRLLGPFQAWVAGRPVALPPAAQRLVTFLAVHAAPQPRGAVAAALWPATPVASSRGPLQRAVRACRRLAPGAVAASPTHLWLGGTVRVDGPSLLGRPLHELAEDVPAAVARLGVDLLVGWEDDWAVAARRRHRQGRLQRLEELSGHLGGAGRFSEALDVAMAAVADDPLRTSAHRRAVEVHLAQGHVGEAVRHVHRFAALFTAGDAEVRRAELLHLVERCSNVRALGGSRRDGLSGPERPHGTVAPDDQLARQLHPAGKGRRTVAEWGMGRTMT